MTTYTVEIQGPDDDAPQRLVHMSRSFAVAVREWWHDDVEGYTTVNIYPELAGKPIPAEEAS